MATTRSIVRVAADADDVWAAISDAAAFAEWAPAATESWMEGSVRHVRSRTGLVITEDVVTNDDGLRRFQYRVTGPIPLRHHLATVDVVDLGPGDALLLYSTEVEPAPMVYVFGGFIAEAAHHLAALLEAGEPIGRRAAATASASADSSEDEG